MTTPQPQLSDEELEDFVVNTLCINPLYDPNISMRDVKQSMEDIRSLIATQRDIAVQRSEKRANGLNDGLRRAAEWMWVNDFLPPDTTTVDGIRSYFLNEARFAELTPKKESDP